MKPYGKELVLDLHQCDPTTMTRESIEQYFIELCDLIDMEREDLHWWDDQDTPEEEKETEPHLIGVSAIQFIRTSNITIHTLTLMERVYLNIFSCKDYDANVAKDFSVNWFKGKIIQSKVFERM